MAKKGGNKPLAVIYATALYDAAAEAGVLNQVSSEILTIKDLCTRMPEAERFLVSPTISFGDKRKVIESALNDLTKITRNFLLVVVDRGRAQLLRMIADAFVEHSNRKEGIASVEVHTARALEDHERVKLVEVLQSKLSKRINLNEKVEPQLLGGLVLMHEDTKWDGSAAYSLKRLIERMEALKLTQVKWTES